MFVVLHLVCNFGVEAHFLELSYQFPRYLHRLVELLLLIINLFVSLQDLIFKLHALLVHCVNLTSKIVVVENGHFLVHRYLCVQLPVFFFEVVGLLIQLVHVVEQ